MNTFWSLWIIVLTLACLVFVVWILLANRKAVVFKDHHDHHPAGKDVPSVGTTGHVYDGIEEYNYPLPKWWFYTFLLTVIFTAGYLFYYPGLGAYAGYGNWTSQNQLEAEQAEAKTVLAKTLGVYATMPVAELSKNEDAMKMGVRLFANNCAVCHGADGGGNFGFPNLTDHDWLWGGSPERIKETITQGRSNNMPAWSTVIGEANVLAAAEFVWSLTAKEFDKTLAAKGATVFSQNCVACHGADAKGNIQMGAPNLTDNIWLYEGTRETIANTIRYGRNNRMPSQGDKLQEDKIHLLSAYVYSLSQN